MLQFGADYIAVIEVNGRFVDYMAHNDTRVIFCRFIGCCHWSLLFGCLGARETRHYVTPARQQLALRRDACVIAAARVLGRVEILAFLVLHRVTAHERHSARACRRGGTTTTRNSSAYTAATLRARH